MRNYCFRTMRMVFGVFSLLVLAIPARADIDGHGPDAWRVTGVSANDFLNARMGPGTNYPVIEKFPPNERGMQQITCVPFYTPAHYIAMSEAQIKALPPRWCLMRNASMTKAGWVLQRYITPDNSVTTSQLPVNQTPVSARNSKSHSGDKIIQDAEKLVRDLYAASEQAEKGRGADPLDAASASSFFTSDIVKLLRNGQLGAHPLYGAQDFDGKIIRIAADPDEPMLRGMITINVDFINFGQSQRAIFYLRADTTKNGAPLRIFRVEHDGWSYP